jgi:hypothetical protein
MWKHIATPGVHSNAGFLNITNGVNVSIGLEMVFERNEGKSCKIVVSRRERNAHGCNPWAQRIYDGCFAEHVTPVACKISGLHLPTDG